MPGTGKKFDLSLVTPDGAVYEGQAEMIIVPGQIGEIGVLARHAPLIATLKAGSTRVYLNRATDDIREFATGAGFFKVDVASYPTVMRIATHCMALAPFAKAHPLKQPGAPASVGH